MICASCGIELHPEALQCWNCSAETANFTEELTSRREIGEKERLHNERLWQNPQTEPATGRKLLRVYRQTWLGKRLAGWVDEYGDTYKSGWPLKPGLLPRWSVDADGNIYIEAGGYRAFIGWLGEDGVVYAQHGRPSSGFFSYPEAMWFFRPRVAFSPTPMFQVRADGKLFHSAEQGGKFMGWVEGAPSVDAAAGLALVTLL